MKVLVTGATGLVGTQLTTLLRSHGHEVHYLTTRREAIEHQSDYKGFLWNVANQTIDPACLEGVDRMIHLAGETVFQRWTEAAKTRIMDSRVNSTRLLLDLLRNNKHQITHVTTASAVGIYPDVLEGSPLRESDVPPVADNFLGDVCVAWEREGRKFASMGLGHAIVRIGIVLAAKGGALEQMAKPVKLYAGAGFGSGRMWQSWIAIDDLTSIFKFIATEQLEGVYNAVAPQPIRNRMLIETIGDVLGKPVVLPNVPQFALKIALGDMAAIVLSSQYASSKTIEAAGYTFRFKEVRPALEEYL